jgi:predicted pyridoxine 5'-phosphate oxidase superfamily flavin-nucleotide-binding protein
MSTLITRIDDLRALYGPARERSVKKELPQLDAHAVRFIGLAPLVVLASRGPTEATWTPPLVAATPAL